MPVGKARCSASPRARVARVLAPSFVDPELGVRGVAQVFKEFRDFLLRGNVIELAVAVAIGAAFGAVIGSFTADILTPLLGLIGVPDFSTLTLTTSGGAVI